MWAATALGAAQEEGACAQEGTTLKPHQPSPVYKNLLYAESKVTGATNVMGGDCCWETSAMQGRRKKLVQPFSGKLRHCTSSSETCKFKQILGSWAKQNELVLLTLDSRTQSLVALASSKLPLNVSSQREDIPVGKDYQQLVLFQTNVHLLLQAVFRYLVAVSSYSHAETQKLMSKPETRKKIYSSKARVRSRKVQCSKWPKKFEGISGFGQFGLHFLLSWIPVFLWDLNCLYLDFLRTWSLCNHQHSRGQTGCLGWWGGWGFGRGPRTGAWALVLQLSHDIQSQRKAASSSHAQDHLGFNCFSSWTLSSECGFSSTAKSNVFPS